MKLERESHKDKVIQIPWRVTHIHERAIWRVREIRIYTHAAHIKKKETI